MATQRYEISPRVLKHISQERAEHEKQDFVSPSGHAIFCFSYQHVPMKSQTISLSLRGGPFIK